MCVLRFVFEAVVVYETVNFADFPKSVLEVNHMRQ